MLFFAENFPKAMGVGSEMLGNDIVFHTLDTHYMRSYGFIEGKRLTLDNDRVDFHPSNGMRHDSHLWPFLCIKGRYSLDVSHDMNHFVVVITTQPHRLLLLWVHTSSTRVDLSIFAIRSVESNPLVVIAYLFRSNPQAICSRLVRALPIPLPHPTNRMGQRTTEQ